MTDWQSLKTKAVAIIGIAFTINFQPGGLQLYQNRNSSTSVFFDFCKIFKNDYFVEHLRTAASEKQQMNNRFNIKNGSLENPFNYLPEK